MASEAEGRILLVEDDPALRGVLGDTLRDEGYPVAVAHDGHDALRYLRAYAPPRLMLVDLYMPGMGGLELLAICRNAPRWTTIPVLILSGDPDAAARAVATDKFAGTLDKPIRRACLLQAVNDLYGPPIDRKTGNAP